MATKQQLYDALAKLQEENYLLKSENERYRQTLLTFYLNSKSVLGIEAAIQEKEDKLQKERRDYAKQLAQRGIITPNIPHTDGHGDGDFDE